MRPIAALLLILVALPAEARNWRCDAEGVTERYDRLFKRAAKRHLRPGFDWCWVKAWAMAESNLKADAVSPVGAVGILQVMPGTARDVARQLGRGSRVGSLRDAANNIEIAAAYIQYLHRLWSYPRPAFCRLKLVMASYNAGPGNVIEAQKESGGRRCWGHISAHLHKVTGKHSEETISYVNRIVENYLRLKGLIQ